MRVSLRKPISFSNSFSSYNGAVPILTWFMFTHSTGRPSPAVPWYRIYLSSIPFTCRRYHQRLTRPYVCCIGRGILSPRLQFHQHAPAPMGAIPPSLLLFTTGLNSKPFPFHPKPP